MKNFMMCDNANLIDLSLEEETQSTDNKKTDLQPSISTNNNNNNNNNNPHTACFVDAPLIGRVSLDNNPFDSIEKLACRQSDPFEIVEKEAWFKAKHAQIANNDVKLGNLLSLSDEDLLGIDEDREEAKCSKEQAAIQENSNSPLVRLRRKESETGTPDSLVSTTSGDSGSAGNKNKKLNEYRKQLLKLSITNAAFNSPVNGRSCANADADVNDSFMHNIFADATKWEESMLSAESPLKFVDDGEMLDEEEQPINLFKSEADFEADLEMLNIPMLKELPSPPKEFFTKDNSLERLQVPRMDAKQEDNLKAGLTTLEAIRAKLRDRENETNNNNDVAQLLQGLKSLISDINAVDPAKKQQANKLLDTLGKTLTSQAEVSIPTTQLEVPPPAIVRQGTFDMELQDNDNHITSKSDLPEIPPVTEMPDCMFRSSATYDNEPIDEQREFVLPEVDPISPITRPVTPIEVANGDADDIVERLTKLLQQHSLTPAHNSDNSNATVIVVMNNSTLGQLPKTSISGEYSPKDEHHDNSNQTRRRSQSLSLHDKVRVFTLPSNAVLPAAESTEEMKAPSSIPDFKTPGRFLPRRNSFSSGTTPYASNLSMSARRFAEAVAAERATPQQRRFSIAEAQQEKQRQHQAAAVVRKLPPMPQNKRKVGQQTKSIMKSTAPLKATIPFKRDVPLIKTAPPVPDLATIMQTDVSSSRHRLNSSMQTVVTSTPMAYSRTVANVDNGASSFPSFPNVNATPSMLSTPMRRNTMSSNPSGPTIAMTRRTSITPNSKSLAAPQPSAAAAGLRRRTLTEFKAKSPIKSRLSSVSASRTAESSTSSAKTTTSRFAPRATQTSRLSSYNNRSASGRPSSTRLTLTSNTQKNKENKQP